MKKTIKLCPPERGFILILVLVTLLLMFILCLTYLRVMRIFSTNNAAVGGGDINLVFGGVGADIATVIGQDGNLNVQEPYDYPWTCTRKNMPYHLRYPYNITGVGALGDPCVDDSWLAPLELGADKKWSQVSNLYGSFLDYEDAGFPVLPINPFTLARVPSDAPAGIAVSGVANGRSVVFQNLDTTAGSADFKRMVDADGDGVPDALWVVPPQSMQPGANVRYLAAIRIIDASAMLNVNTALGELGQDPTLVGTGTPRKGEGSYEIDGSSLLGAMSATSKTLRQGSVAAGPSGRAPTAWTNWDYWWASGANTQNSGDSQGNNRYASSVVEAKLRDYGHTFSSDGTDATRFWRDYPALGDNAGSRKYVTTASGVCDVYAALPSSPDRDAPTAASFARARRPFDIYGNQNNINMPVPPTGYPAISGGVLTTSFTNGAWWDQAQFWHDNGSGAVNTGYGVSDFLVGIDANAYANAALTTNTDNDLTYPFPAGFRFALQNQGATWWARPLVFQRQMACNIAAALGRDNITHRDNYSEWSGWEPLPVLTEFYAQMPYVMMSPSFLTASATVVFPNKQVSDFTSAAQLEFPLIGGGGIGNGSTATTGSNQTVRAAVCRFDNTTAANQITAQLQYQDASYVKCCKIQLNNSGTDVVGKVLYAKYSNTLTLGSDFDAAGPASVAIATAYNGAGYGASLGQATISASTGGNYSAMYWNPTASRATATTPADVTYAAGDWRNNLSAGVGSYAFELANPYAFPVRLCNLRFEFKRSDYGTPFEQYAAGGKNSDGTNNAAGTPASIKPPGLTVESGPNPANASHSTSADLSTYITSAPSNGTTTLTRDAEGYWVLRPSERIVFYRNGFDGKKADGTNRNKPFSGSPDVSGLISTDCYKVDLGSDPAVPDLNGHPATWKVEYFEIQCRNQDRSGSVYAESSPTAYNGAWNYNTWVPWQHAVYRTLPSGWNNTSANNCECETNIPAGRQGCPGDLVYRQMDVRAFGADEKLDCLQARPPKYPATAWSMMPVDMGDCAYRTNYYTSAVSGTLATRFFPAGGTIPTTTGWPSSGWTNLWYDNTASTLALGHPNPGTNPLTGTPYKCWDYNADPSGLSALGSLTKVAFPGANSALYPTGRQSIKNEIVSWNYVGLPDDSKYPGTFPELTTAKNANKDVRNNSAANAAVQTRRDGLPRTMDLLKVPLISNFVHYPGVTGNSNYRGLTGGQNWAAVPMPSTSPWIGSAWQNTLGDALNFYLMQDTQKLGLRGLCLRTDVNWFDWPNAGTKYKVYNGATPYPLAYAGTTPYVTGMEALSGTDIFQAQQTITGITPDPTPGTGNVGPAGSGKPWSYSNGPYARASQFWQISWGEILASRWQVDSPKYMGANGAGASWKAGLINLNTAPKSVLKCLSLPYQPGSITTPVSADSVADKIIANRQAPVAGAATAGGVRQGLVLPSEAFGPGGLKSYTADAALLAGSGTTKFYTGDKTFNLETLSWLPQQASCRSDMFIAYVLVQGYAKDDFTMGPIECKRQIMLFSRDGSGGPATLVGAVPYTVPD